MRGVLHGLGRWLSPAAAIGAGGLFVMATPLVSHHLLHLVELRIPPPVGAAAAGAIIVLGGDVRHGGGDGTRDGLGPLSEERVRRAAVLYRAHPLPVAVSGRAIGRSRVSVARLMQEALEHDFAIPVTWVEEQSGNTFENARDVAPLLQTARISTVFIVTQPWHMPRALWCFRQAGLDAVPAPTSLTALPDSLGFRDLLPEIDGLRDSYYALHEMIGIVYYRLYYGRSRAATALR